ncbi:MAG: hypothetical protein SFW63_08800 [Alphaproteobacteria bacterium]|nr:hypothetical protein [Alphaproteobacteria bacterium]
MSMIKLYLDSKNREVQTDVKVTGREENGKINIQLQTPDGATTEGFVILNSNIVGKDSRTIFDKNGHRIGEMPKNVFDELLQEKRIEVEKFKPTGSKNPTENSIGIVEITGRDKVNPNLVSFRFIADDGAAFDGKLDTNSRLVSGDKRTIYDGNNNAIGHMPIEGFDKLLKRYDEDKAKVQVGQATSNELDIIRRIAGMNPGEFFNPEGDDNEDKAKKQDRQQATSIKSAISRIAGMNPGEFFNPEGDDNEDKAKKQDRQQATSIKSAISLIAGMNPGEFFNKDSVSSGGTIPYLYKAGKNQGIT